MIALTIIGGKRFEQKATKETKRMIGRGLRPSRHPHPMWKTTRHDGTGAIIAMRDGHDGRDGPAEQDKAR